MEYLLVKWVHIVSSTVLFGAGIGSAFCLFMANRSKEVPSIYFATRTVVIADFLFTSPAAVVQLLTGLWLLRLTCYSLSDSWVKWDWHYISLPGRAGCGRVDAGGDARHGSGSARNGKTPA
jgi:uncharacterized membrane protein